MRGWLVSLKNDTRQPLSTPIKRQQQSNRSLHSRVSYYVVGTEQLKRSQKRSPKRASEKRLAHPTHLEHHT